MAGFDAHVEAQAAEYIGWLVELCRQPTIAAEGVGIREGAHAVVDLFRRVGIEARAVEAEGASPTVYGEIGTGERTLLVYNHYDVQPAVPLDLWESPPFEPTIRDGALYARGVADNRGDLVARLAAVDAYRRTVGELPLRLKFVVEGEEETGSFGLDKFVAAHRSLLVADGCLWEGGNKDVAGRPTLYCGLKGICYLELRARGARTDLHSSWATIVPNPAWRLVWALNTLKDPQDRITVDGLLDHVVEPSPLEMEYLRRIPFDTEKLKSEFGIAGFVKDLPPLDLLQKHLCGPTCTICGLESGYTGAGLKTVLPSAARVKLDFRLVPNLTPELVLRLLREHLDRRGFGDLEVVYLGSEHPAKSPLDAPVVQAAIDAGREVYGQPPVVYPLMAGSGPMYTLCQALGIAAVSGGVGNASSNEHAPNENIRLVDFVEGIRFFGHLMDRFAGK